MRRCLLRSKLDANSEIEPKINRNTASDFAEIPSVIVNIFATNVIEMAYVQIRAGVGNWLAIGIGTPTPGMGHG